MNVLIVLLVSAALPLMSTAGAEEEYVAGEAAFRVGDASAAEAHLRRALEIDPHHLRALLRLAAVVSWGDRLDESVSLYERALQMDPGNREGRLGLARVSSWRGDLDRALSLYGDLRQEDPGGREATLGLARTHAWAGHHNDARQIYIEYLADHPGDVEARNGLAEVLSWDGELDDALALYEETLRTEPSNRDALAGRARVLHWMGRTPQAWLAVGEALQVNPDDREALKLGAAIEEGMTPVLSAWAGVMHDSDRNAVSTQRLALGGARSSSIGAGASYDRFAAAQPDATGSGWLEGRLETVRGFGSVRLGEDLVLSGSLGLEQITHDDGGTARHLAGSAGADLRIDDHWSLSGALSQETYPATARSLDRGVSTAAATVTVGFTPASRIVTRWTAQRAVFNEHPDDRSHTRIDHNERNLLTGYARWSVPLRRPRLGLSWLGRFMSYARSTGNGYFSPDDYVANLGIADLSDRIGRRAGWSLEGTLGVQRVRGFGGGWSSDRVRGYRAAAWWEIVPGLTLEGYAGGTNLALAAGSGYRSTESGLRLRWRIGTLVRPAREAASPAAGGSAEEGAP